MKEYFSEQIKEGNDILFYGLQKQSIIKDKINHHIKILSHEGSLDTFPNLEFIRMLDDTIPLFKDN